MFNLAAVLTELLAFGLVLLLASLPQAQDTASRLPEGEGKEDVAGTCTACHSLARVLTNRLDAATWLQRIENHQSRGLSLPAEEAAPLVAYLSTYFGPLVNINHATVTELAGLPSVDEKLAQAIVRHREKNGPFEKIEDLEDVEGVSAEIFAKVRNRLTTSSEEGESRK
jgi:competence ComEA-like helix-hairpin-helix protein